MADPYVERFTDTSGQHRARVRAGNHEKLMVISESIRDPRDVETALVRTAEALLLDEQLADRIEHAVLSYLERRMLPGVIGTTPPLTPDQTEAFKRGWASSIDADADADAVPVSEYDEPHKI